MEQLCTKYIHRNTQEQVLPTSKKIAREGWKVKRRGGVTGTDCTVASGKRIAGQRMREEVRKRCKVHEGKWVGTLRPEAKNDPEVLTPSNRFMGTKEKAPREVGYFNRQVAKLNTHSKQYITCSVLSSNEISCNIILNPYHLYYILHSMLCTYALQPYTVQCFFNQLMCLYIYSR